MSSNYPSPTVMLMSENDKRMLRNADTVETFCQCHNGNCSACPLLGKRGINCGIAFEEIKCEIIAKK